MMTVFGFIGKTKLDQANTNLWLSGQEVLSLEQDLRNQQEVIANLRNEAKVTAALAAAKSKTPEMAFKYAGTSGVEIKVLAEINVRPSPAVTDASYGTLPVGTTFYLDSFYSYPNKLEEDRHSWIGIPTLLLNGAERESFPSGALNDEVVWISYASNFEIHLSFSGANYLNASGKVDLAADVAAERGEFK